MSRAKSRYFLVWRWHFYAGFFAAPFMLILSLTGLVMLFDDEIEMARYSDVLSVTIQQTELPISYQLDAVKQQYPDSIITQFIPAISSDQANRFNVRSPGGKSVLVTIDPFTGDVLGEIDRSNSWYELANKIHGTLLIGNTGDFLIETAASISMLLLISGLYLWFPTDRASRAGFLVLRMSSGLRIFMRDLHANLGGILSLILFLFLLSGLAWTGVWGAKLVQGWNTFPPFYTWGEKPESQLTHSSLNHGSEEEMPWNLELAILPESQHEQHNAESHLSATEQEKNDRADKAVSIDVITQMATELGFSRYKLFLPLSETGVYTLAANTMAGDIVDPRDDRTTHIDQYSGKVLIDVTWHDYSIFAKLMAAGVSWHQGDMGLLNKVANAFFCFSFIAISVTGIYMWWIRRPKNQSKLGVPARFEHDGVWKTAIGSTILVCLCFPLAGVLIIAALAADMLIVKHSAKLQNYLS
ncbi:PepSY-associated TM helix domain-containing protein [Vibrio sp. SCSIO 43137]|uniref:PepSY-associated TM helix domain-containing protein n=1 Tax=Vibrio sp. SCSIO 43137 TaxID=3021011 RepID=UPI00230760E6|nr:PepSY domain-containing protein [Vibrio sp. SCSIO 43137]WCE31250.1 PepSY domain-containing protein [Vibrio sp. SCSIO 43137]